MWFLSQTNMKVMTTSCNGIETNNSTGLYCNPKDYTSETKAPTQSHNDCYTQSTSYLTSWSCQKHFGEHFAT